MASNRGTLPATVTLLEAARTVAPDLQPVFTTDGNPSYSAGLHFINAQRLQNHQLPIPWHQVIGLQNLDSESETYRQFKQLIERFNRSYKSHTHSAHGFNHDNGAISLTTLVVTDYNFLRPHTGLGGDVPIPLPELRGLSTLQNKWCILRNMALALPPPAAGARAGARSPAANLVAGRV